MAPGNKCTPKVLHTRKLEQSQNSTITVSCMTETKRIIKAGWRLLREEGFLTLTEDVLKKVSRREFYIRTPAPDERVRARNLEVLKAGAPDKLSIPPLNLVELATGTTNLEQFLEGGRIAVMDVDNLLRKNSLNLYDLEAILDFGCGCGRATRYLKAIKKVCGCDFNSEAVNWAKDHLSFAEFTVNQLQPPTNYQDNEFDLILVLSVLTHMPEELGRQWMGEFRRLIRRQGFLVLSLHGESFSEQLTMEERCRFLDGHVVVRESRHAGRNRCAVFHPNEYVREQLAKEFHLLDFLPRGLQNDQDLYLLQNLK